MSRGMDKVIEDLRVNAQPIVEQCTKDEKTCSRANKETNCCTAYFSPKACWRIGNCLMADEFLKTITETKETGKVRVGQQKQKKKAKR